MDLHALSLDQVSKLFRWEGFLMSQCTRNPNHVVCCMFLQFTPTTSKETNMLVHEMFTAGKSPAPFISPHDSLVQRYSALLHCSQKFVSCTVFPRKNQLVSSSVTSCVHTTNCQRSPCNVRCLKAGEQRSARFPHAVNPILQND